MTMSHPFLSDNWFEAVQAIDPPEPPPAMQGLVVNVSVTGGPEGDRQVHLDSGRFRVGHVDDAPTTVTVPYEVAKKMFIDNDPQAAMQGFMSGQIRISGDITKLMSLQMVQPSPDQIAFAAKLREMTE
jgi:hypothetical protein